MEGDGGGVDEAWGGWRVCVCMCVYVEEKEGGRGGLDGGREARLSSPLSPASPPLTKRCLNLDPSHQPSLGF